jgi:hypothetical protein
MKALDQEYWLKGFEDVRLSIPEENTREAIIKELAVKEQAANEQA